MLSKFKIPKTKNAKGVVSLFVGNTISKVIFTLCGFVLAKLYGPESYGIYGAFLSYIAIVTVFGSMRLESIVVLEKSVKSIRNVFTVTQIIIPILITIVTVIIVIAKAIGYNIPLTYGLIITCGIISIVSAIINVHRTILEKYKCFNQISISLVLFSLVCIIAQFILYYSGFNNLGLVYGWIFGTISSFLYLLFIIKKRFVKINISKFVESVKTHKKVVQFTYPSEVLNIFGNNIITVFGFYYFTAAEVGIFVLASKLILTPVILISNSFAKVYMQKAVSVYQVKQDVLFDITKKIIYTCTGIILAYLVFINSIGIYLLELYFGEKWNGVGYFVLILSSWGLIRSATLPVASILVVANRNQITFYFNVYLFITSILALITGHFYNSFNICVSFFAISSVLGYIVLLYQVIQTVRN